MGSSFLWVPVFWQYHNVLFAMALSNIHLLHFDRLESFLLTFEFQCILSGTGKNMFGILMETELTVCLTLDGIDILTRFIIITQEIVGISNFGVLVPLISVSL